MTVTVNRPTSTLAQGLTDYQNSFYKEASKDKSIGGLIQYHVVGTILTASITLILHAEAVRRAVIICFLSIVKTFSQSNSELMETQQKEWTLAYSQSLRSFCGLFNGKMLLSDDKPSQSSSPEEIKLPAVPLAIQAADAAEIFAEEEIQPNQMALLEPVPVIERLIEEVQAHDEEADGVLVNEPDEPDAEDAFENVAPLVEADDDDAPLVAEDDLAFPLLFRELRDDPLEQPVLEIPDPEGFVPVGEVEAGIAEREYDRAHIVFVDLPNGEADDDFEHLPDPALEKAAIRRVTENKQLAILDSQDVHASLALEIADAAAEVRTGDKEIPYIHAPQDRVDPRWKFSSGVLDRHLVGHCHYAKGDHTLGAQHLASMLELDIQGRSIRVPIFGLFDPQIGPKAAQYLVQYLPKALSTGLSQFNRGGLTQDGIWNGLTQAFLKLNSMSQGAVASDGSSVALVLIVEDYIWVCHLGNTRVALDNGGDPKQMTTTPDPKSQKYRNLVLSLGGDVDERGVVNGLINVATGFGRADLQGAISGQPSITQFPMNQLKADSHLVIQTVGIAEATSTERQLRWVREDRASSAKDIAHSVTHSVHEANQASQLLEIRDRSLSTIIVKINAVPEPDDDWHQVPEAGAGSDDERLA